MLKHVKYCWGLLRSNEIILFWQRDPIIMMKTEPGLNPLIKDPVNKTYKWFVKCNLRVLRIFMGLGLELIFGSLHETEKYYSISFPIHLAISRLFLPNCNSVIKYYRSVLIGWVKTCYLGLISSNHKTTIKSSSAAWGFRQSNSILVLI